MTRGKYANRAAIARTDAEVTTTLATYQSTVKRLTEENKTLKQRLSDQQRVHAQDVKVLKAQLNEGLSPEMAAREHEIRTLRADRDRLRREYAELLKKRDSYEKRLMAALISEGWTSADVMAIGIGDNTQIANDAAIKAHRRSQSEPDATKAAFSAALMVKPGSELIGNAHRRQNDPEWMARFHANLDGEVAS